MDSIDHVVINEDPLVQKPTGYGQINLMQKIRFKPNENWDMQYGFHYSETTPYSRYDRLIETAPNGLPRAAVWNYGPQTWMMNQLSIAHQSTSKLFNEMSFRFALQSFGESRIDRNYSGGNRFRLRTQEENVDAYSANIDFEKASGVHKFYYGAEYILNDVTSRGSAIDIRDGSDIPTPDRYPASTWNSIGAYVNYQYKVSERLLFQSGVRVSQFSIQSDFSRHLSFFPFDFTESRINKRAVTGSIGAVYTPAPTWKISVNASTGFRAPNVDDIGKLFDFASGEVVVPNASLKSEYAYNGEVHVSKVFGDWLKLDVTGFYTQLQDAMVRRAFQVNGMDSILYNGSMSKVFAIQNAAKANVYGFNAGFEIKLPYRFTLFSRYNYQLGQEEMDNGTTSRSRHAAPAYGVTRLSYVYKKLNMQFYSMYSAGVSNGNLNEEEKQKPFLYAKDENGLPFSPSWVTFNLKSMYQISDHMIVSAGVENLTDRRYRPYSSGIVAAGRNMVLSLTAKF
jgi:hemoglobin/transferrin/lactoferrin receptor protein